MENASGSLINAKEKKNAQRLTEQTKRTNYHDYEFSYYKVNHQNDHKLKTSLTLMFHTKLSPPRANFLHPFPSTPQSARSSSVPRKGNSTPRLAVVVAFPFRTVATKNGSKWQPRPKKVSRNPHFSSLPARFSALISLTCRSGLPTGAMVKSHD